VFVGGVAEVEHAGTRGKARAEITDDRDLQVIVGARGQGHLRAVGQHERHTVQFAGAAIVGGQTSKLLAKGRDGLCEHGFVAKCGDDVKGRSRQSVRVLPAVGRPCPVVGVAVNQSGLLELVKGLAERGFAVRTGHLFMSFPNQT